MDLNDTDTHTGVSNMCTYSAITQETFDNAVKENREVFDLNEKDAMEETVHQFESQGVNLGGILVKPMASQELGAIKTAVEKLEQLQKTKGSLEAVNAILKEITAACDQGIPHRIAAGKADAYRVLLDTYETFNDKDVRTNVLKALIALMTKQPDLLDGRGIAFIISNLKDQRSDPQLQRLILKWTKESCVKHETNRQQIYDSHIVDILKDFLIESTPIEVIRETLSVCRALVLDDDIRVEFGRAHEHARVIASETLCSIMTLLSKYRGEEQLNADIMLTLTALMVRAEFCKKVDDAGGIDLIKNAMETFAASDKIIRQGFKLIKALAGDDECKAYLITKGYTGVLRDSMLANMESAGTVTAGLAAVAAMTLRSPQNSKAFFDAGIPDVIITAMKQHPEQKAVQKAGSWAIRNMVSRSQYQCAKFIELGAEDVLQQNLGRFKDTQYDVKAALRDLGCNVVFKEEWTGKGGALTTGKIRE